MLLALNRRAGKRLVRDCQDDDDDDDEVPAGLGPGGLIVGSLRG